MGLRRDAARSSAGARTLLGSLVSVVLGTGCPAPSTILRDSTATVVDSTMATLDTEESRKRLREILGAVDVQTAARELTAGVLRASGEALSKGDLELRIQALTTHFVDALAKSAVHAIDTDLGPAARKQLVAAITEALAAGTSPDARARMAGLAAAVADSAAQAFGRQLPGMVGPEMRGALVALVDDSLAPAIATGLEKLTPSVGNLARVATRDALLGVNDALAGDLGRTIDAREAHLWDGLERMLNRSQSTAREWLYVAVTVGIVLLGGLFAAIVFLRRALRDRQAREDTVTLLTSSIHSAAAKGGARDVLDRIESLKAHPGTAYLNEYLERNPHVRVD